MLVPPQIPGVAGVEQDTSSQNQALQATGAGDDPRVALAQWITSPENPYFARNLANRYWGYLFGRGLVHPVDDQRPTNPPSHPELLDLLAGELASHDFDAQHLLRLICNSRTYQLAAELEPARDRNGMLLTHHVPRRLPAEVLWDAVNRAAGTSASFPGLPPDMRAIALPDAAVQSEFLDVFGRPKRTTPCLCERRNTPDLRQVLHLLNNPALQQLIASDAGRIPKLLAAGKSDREICEELYLAALSRFPDDEEMQSMLEYVAGTPDRRKALEDVLWAVLNTAEFAYLR
jgi:hypothetical protein